MVVGRILQVIDYKGISKSRFYRETGLSNGFLDKVKDVGVSKIEYILKTYPEINSDWLLTGNGDMLKSKSSELVSMNPDVGRPFYDVDFTLGFEGVDNNVALHPEFNINFPPANREGVNWFRGKGNSMIGEINSGDYIALEEVGDFSWFPLGRIYGVVTKNGFRTIKRVVKSDNKDEYLLVSSNPDKTNYPDQVLPKNMIHKLYKVVFVIKDLDE